jgi:hypothetical protein
MKKFISIPVICVISFVASAQSTGDYRSVGSGNWNDPAKWEVFNGSDWSNASTYPGQNSGTGTVTISINHIITITASVPQKVASVSIQSFFDEEYEFYVGTLIFSSENAVSLSVSGTLDISGTLYVEDRIGSKSHALIIGGSLSGNFKGINGDDKINVVFNSNVSNSIVGGGTFQDVTFNGSVFTLQGNMVIHGKIFFMNGIVNTYDYNVGGSPAYDLIYFRKGATWSGASIKSHIDGWVGKEGDEPFTFPVGENGIYAPLTISAPVGQSEIFFARYNRTSGSELGGITDPELFNISSCEYWDLVPGNGQYTKLYPLSITVGWNASSGCGTSSYITNVSEVTLAHFDRTSWSSHGGTGTGTTENGSVTWSGVTAFSPFTLGNLGICKTPSGLTATNFTGNSATLNWSPVAGAESYDVYYATFPTAPVSLWKNAVAGTVSTFVNLVGLEQATKYWYRVRANCIEGSSSYRQSEFTTLTVCDRPTGLTTTVTNYSATFNWNSVPGATGYEIELGRGYGNDWISINGVITSTSYTVDGLSSTYYTWRVRAICPEGYSHYQNSEIFWVPMQPPLPPPPPTPSPECIDAYESNNTSSQAKPISIGSIIAATVSSATDIDWYNINISTASTTMKLTLNNLPADYDLYIYDKSLKLLGSSAATGTSNEVVTYKSKARNATIYIKVVGKNGASHTSQCYHLLAQTIATVKSASYASDPVSEIPESSNNHLLYPNPASEFVMLQFNSIVEGSANVQILNSTGQMVKSSSVTLTKGFNQLQISMSDVRPGMYLLKINHGELNLIKRFVIAKK